jgi:hypothetical protein
MENNDKAVSTNMINILFKDGIKINWPKFPALVAAEVLQEIPVENVTAAAKSGLEAVSAAAENRVLEQKLEGKKLTKQINEFDESGPKDSSDEHSEATEHSDTTPDEHSDTTEHSDDEKTGGGRIVFTKEECSFF